MSMMLYASVTSFQSFPLNIKQALTQPKLRQISVNSAVSGIHFIRTTALRHRGTNILRLHFLTRSFECNREMQLYFEPYDIDRAFIRLPN
jgi:hypothetical protein